MPTEAMTGCAADARTRDASQTALRSRMAALRRGAWIVAVLVAGTACRSKSACDIRDPACQRDIFYSVLDARGQAWDAWANPPPMEVMTKDQFRAFLEASAASSQGSDSAEPSWDPVYKLLGFLDRDASSAETSIDSQVEGVVAFYSRTTRSVTIIDRGMPSDEESSSMTLAHEIVHALQDRDVGLSLYVGSGLTSDELMARRSMVEGEATLYGLMVNLGMRELAFQDVNWAGYFESFRDTVDESVASSAGRLGEARRLLPYVAGAHYLEQAYARGGTPEVEFAFLAKPPSLSAVVDSYDAPVPVRAPLSCGGPPPPGGYEQVGSSRLGAAGLYAFAIKNLRDGRAWDLMRAWSDDTLRFYQSPEGATAVSWTVRLNGKRGFNDYFSTLQNVAAGLGARSQARLTELEIVIGAAEQPLVLSDWDLGACGE
ncbi:MAG: hypothetical protein HY901_01035 [Deltaproteobacteria bacterium]|nr:hypothetical protein [Deltaproteobacteria bacterium]